MAAGLADLRAKKADRIVAFPFPKIFMDGTGTPEFYLRQPIPLAAHSKHKDDTFEGLARLHRFTATARSLKIFPFSLWNEKLIPF